jgi:predicted Fe-Mo cluster-binding NifX family protein
VDVLLTGHVGPNAFKTLNAAGIKVGVDLSNTVREALDRFNADGVAFTDDADVEAHW